MELALVFTRRNEGRLLLPGVLIGAAAAVYALALA